ncbi:hypothetical protein MSAN_00253300 [Mycena sanguinolenta]|uniref:DUF6533 domain-containing protein n=1 Tax=Mycena sanguinolenta TaxID=230812 RepID=A0A8H7DK24_9AGAR|nr:hypothetical protein MSAN_00253300 [Mycena sanguinolenta]
MSDTETLALGFSVTWANYALVAAAVIYIYDCILTLALEVQLFQEKILKSGGWRLFLQMAPLRYLALVYQFIIIYGLTLAHITPQARTHARNYIAPFVDSITALLATRFILGVLTRGKDDDDNVKSFVSSRRSFESPYQTPHSSVPSLHPEGPHLPPGLPGSPATTLSSEGSRLPPDPDLSVLFPAWPPAMNETEESSTVAAQQTLGRWPSNNSLASLTVLESGGLRWPPETFDFEYDDDEDPQTVLEAPQVIIFGLTEIIDDNGDPQTVIETPQVIVFGLAEIIDDDGEPQTVIETSQYANIEPIPMHRGRRGSRTRIDTPLIRAAFNLGDSEDGVNAAPMEAEEIRALPV